MQLEFTKKALRELFIMRE